MWVSLLSTHPLVERVVVGLAVGIARSQ